MGSSGNKENVQRPYSIEYDETLDAILFNWNGRINSGTYRTGIEDGLKKLEETAAANYLVTSETLYLNDRDDLQWAIDTGINRLQDIESLERIALTHQDSILIEVNLQKVASEIGAKVPGADLRVFTNIEDAKDWFRNA